MCLCGLAIKLLKMCVGSGFPHENEATATRPGEDVCGQVLRPAYYAVSDRIVAIWVFLGSAHCAVQGQLVAIWVFLGVLGRPCCADCAPLAPLEVPWLEPSGHVLLLGFAFKRPFSLPCNTLPLSGRVAVASFPCCRRGLAVFLCIPTTGTRVFCAKRRVLWPP